MRHAAGGPHGRRPRLATVTVAICWALAAAGGPGVAAAQSANPPGEPGNAPALSTATGGSGQASQVPEGGSLSSSTTAPTVLASAPDANSASSSVGAGTLPHNLSPWSMFVHADIVVKVVMVGLALASLVTWTVGLARSFELIAAGRTVRRALRTIVAERSLGEAGLKLTGTRGVVRSLHDAAALEVRLSSGIHDRVGIKERVASRLTQVELAAGRTMTQGTGILATIGSTAPFVGLFGTVWGIMNSFIGISKAETTNLAVVAPGIAEALLATAVGLIAAIPAVIIYNLFARWISAYKALVADASAEVMRLASRDLDRHMPPAVIRAAE